MIHTIFEWREDQEYGGEGWIMKGQPDFNTSDGRGIAHDTLEHFPGKYGSLADEMLAFGSMLYIRGETSWFSRRAGIHKVSFHMGSDIARFLEDLNYDSEKSLATAPRTCRLEEHLEEDISDSMLEAIKIRNYDLDEGQERYALNDHTRHMTSWMRIGYRKAKRRWQHNAAFSVVYLFDKIAESVNKGYKNGDFGDELHVRVNPRTLEYRVNREEMAYND